MSVDCDRSEEKPRNNTAYDYDILSINKHLLSYYHTVLSQDSLSSQERNALKIKSEELASQNYKDDRLRISYKDVVFLHSCLKKGECKDEGSPVYLHKLMKLSVLELPSPAPLERSAEYESKMERLRRLADEREYQKMTKNVSTQAVVQENLGQELKKMDSQVTFLFNFVLTVLGAFAFGYKAVEYSLASPNVSLQLTAGMTLATIVFFADIYFIIKDYV